MHVHTQKTFRMLDVFAEAAHKLDGRSCRGSLPLRPQLTRSEYELMLHLHTTWKSRGRNQKQLLPLFN